MDSARVSWDPEGSSRGGDKPGTWAGTVQRQGCPPSGWARRLCHRGGQAGGCRLAAGPPSGLRQYWLEPRSCSLRGGAGWPREAVLSPWSASSVGQRGLQRGVAGSWVPVGWPGSDGVRGGPRAASVLSSCPCSELLRGGESWGLVPSAFPVPDSSSASCFLVRPMRGQARRGPATRRGPTARWKHQAPAFDRGANPACLPSAPRSRARWGQRVLKLSPGGPAGLGTRRGGDRQRCGGGQRGLGWTPRPGAVGGCDRKRGAQGAWGRERG